MIEVSFKSMKVFLLLVASALIAVGCSSADANAESSATTAASTGSTVTSEKAKCDACGKEVAKTDLSSHDGQMWCKDCLSSHSH